MDELLLVTTNPLSLSVERGRRFRRILSIAEQYKAKVKVEKIAEEFGCSKGTVLRIARSFGLDKRERGNAYFKKCCIKAYKHGVPIRAIAKVLNRSQAWVSKAAGSHGPGILRRKFKPRGSHGGRTGSGKGQGKAGQTVLDKAREHQQKQLAEILGECPGLPKRQM